MRRDTVRLFGNILGKKQISALVKCCYKQAVYPLGCLFPADRAAGQLYLHKRQVNIECRRGLEYGYRRFVAAFCLRDTDTGRTLRQSRITR